MHKQIYGVSRLDLTLSPESDLLVQGGQDQESEISIGGPQPPMRFYKARHPETGAETACIPGTGLKGTLRSTSEKILRSFDESLACDPFEEDLSELRCACSHRMDAEKENGQKWRSDQVYGMTCPACRLFGSLVHAGLIEVEDAWATHEQRSSTQARIAIDRFLGGVAPGAMYRTEPLVAGSRFRTTLTVKNFELWQLGLLALALREVNDGQALIGWGTRRGLGRISVHFDELWVCYPRALYDAARASYDGAGNIPAAQRLMQTSQREAASYTVEDLWLGENASPQDSEGWRDAGWRDFRFEDENQIKAFLGDCVEKALAPKLKLGLAGFAHEVRSEK